MKMQIELNVDSSQKLLSIINRVEIDDWKACHIVGAFYKISIHPRTKKELKILVKSFEENLKAADYRREQSPESNYQRILRGEVKRK